MAAGWAAGAGYHLVDDSVTVVCELNLGLNGITDGIIPADRPEALAEFDECVAPFRRDTVLTVLAGVTATWLLTVLLMVGQHLWVRWRLRRAGRETGDIFAAA